jgi:hypothetical protein
MHVIVPEGQRRVGGQCLVIAADDEVDVMDLQVAVRFKKPGVLSEVGRGIVGWKTYSKPCLKNLGQSWNAPIISWQ